jgi:hypothetical protein
MSEEVQAAVHDILHGTSVDSHTEWLQREYIRLMRREAAAKQNESKLEKRQANNVMRNVRNAREDRPTEQHGAEKHAECAVQVPENNDRDAD